MMRLLRRARWPAAPMFAAAALLVVAVSFHTRGDNDFSRAGGKPSAGLTANRALAPDTCPACSLFWLTPVGPSVAVPIAALTVASRVRVVYPPAPILGTSSPVDSRPPPAA